MATPTAELVRKFSCWSLSFTGVATPGCHHSALRSLGKHTTMILVPATRPDPDHSCAVTLKVVLKVTFILI